MRKPIIVAFLILLVPFASQAAQDDVRKLKLGAPVEGELAAGETDTYQVTLKAGQFLHVVVDQRNSDLIVTLCEPGGQAIAEFDSRWHGPEPVSLIAEVNRTYRVEVRQREKEAVAERYEVRIEELREAMPQDRALIAAERASTEGKQLLAQPTAESLRKARQKYEEALTLWREVGDRSGQAQVLNSLGFILNALGDNPKALTYYDQALSLWRAIGYQRGEAETLHNIGAAYSARGEKQKALDYYRQALSLRRVVGDRSGEASTLMNTGAVFASVSELQSALESFSQALSLWQALKNRRMEAGTLLSIGGAYGFLGEHQKALDHFSQALSASRALGDLRGQAYTLNNLGRVYSDLGEQQKALECFNQAIQLLSTVSDPRLQAYVLNNTGGVYDELGERQKALDSYNQALWLFRSVQDRYGEAVALGNCGRSYDGMGERQKALDYYNQALSLHQEVGNRRAEAITLNNIGALYHSLGNLQKAFDSYSQALQLSQTIADRVALAATHYSLARLERDLDHLTDARTHTEATLDLVESLRTKLASQALRTSFLASKQEYYEFYLDLLMQLDEREPSAGHDRAALHASERSRARSLLDLLAEAKVNVQQGIDPNLKKREQANHNQISSVQSQLFTAHSQPKPDTKLIATLEDALKKAESEREQLEAEIRQKHPRYAELHYPTPLDLKAIQGLLDDQTALLEYAVAEGASFLFAVTKTDFLAARLPAGPLISERVEALRQVLIEPKQTTLSSYLGPARWLYQELVQPAAKLLTGKKQLIIVPDGILYYLPFEVLLTSGTAGALQQTGPSRWPYLVGDYAVSYVPSAGILASLRDERARTKPNKTFLAYADPVYRGTEPATIRGFANGKPWELKPLPYSREEVERIAKLYRKEEVTKFMGPEASEENVKAEDRLSQYRYVHFSVHGLLNESEPQYAGLVLSLPREIDSRPKTQDPRPMGQNPKSEIRNPKSEDGLLQVYEIFNLRLNADLVVLSACETGLGKQVKGEGVIGLTRAFLYAGTPSVMVSLWKVLDRSTPELMSRFYRHLNDSQGNKAHALRQAQLEMIRQKGLAHPYYWAPFVLVGRPTQ